MGKVGKALNMMQEAFKKEFGEDAKMESGDAIAGVFNDGVIILEMKEDGLSVEIHAGEPYKFDYDLDLVEKEK